MADWEPVFIDIEGRKFSTWRGVARDPEHYAVIGDFFVTGVDKPTPAQTADIRAIHKDLIAELEPHNLVWKKEIPFAVLTLWDIFVTVGIYVPTGAFVSKNGDSSVGLQIGVLRVDAATQDAW